MTGYLRTLRDDRRHARGRADHGGVGRRDVAGDDGRARRGRALPGTLTASTAAVPVGTSITLSYSVPSAGVTSTNWVGIYEPGQTPGVVASTTYQYTPDASGTVTFSTSSLDGVGNYVAYFFYDNGYQIIAGPVSFSVTPGTLAPAPTYRRAIGAHQLAEPFGVAVTTGGDIWATGTGRNQVTEFDPAGRSLRSVGAGLGLDHPEGIALGPTGDVWVANTGNDRIVELSPAGRLLTSFGAKGSGNGQLDQPVALAASPGGGTVYVADQNNNRIEEFTAAGGYAGSISVPTPAGVAVDRAGDIWVSSPSYASGNQVYEFSAAGSQLQSFGGQERPLKRLADVDVSRRKLLVSATALSGLAVSGAALPANLRKMMAATPHDLRGRLSDIEHIVILMQENRSFDHYFGTMPGVRGFQDPTAITLPGGKSVFYQSDPSHADGYLTPFHYDTKSTSAQQTPGTDHTWGTQHEAWQRRWTSGWRPRASYTMGYFTQPDIPFHWALAQAFTLCDNYHCSVLGPTNPNRLYMWSGMIDPNGTGGGPVTDDSPAFNNAYPSWTTYPERLEAAGVSWQVYQEEDNYDDNALAWFKQFSDAPRRRRCRSAACASVRPAGSRPTPGPDGCRRSPGWSRPPRRPSTRTTSRPPGPSTSRASWTRSPPTRICGAQTLFILTYDENDGMFDHVPPPVPPARRDRAQHQRLAPRHLRRLHHGTAPARRPRPVAVAEPGGQPGRRRGQLPHRPAGSVRQPRPNHPGGQRADPGAIAKSKANQIQCD